MCTIPSKDYFHFQLKTHLHRAFQRSWRAPDAHPTPAINMLDDMPSRSVWQLTCSTEGEQSSNQHQLCSCNGFTRPCEGCVCMLENLISYYLYSCGWQYCKRAYDRPEGMFYICPDRSLETYKKQVKVVETY